MAKRLFAWVLVLALVLSMIPAITLGITAEEALDQHTSHEGWTEWTDTTKLPTTAGQYYLSVDVNLTAVWEAPSGVHLCLNGHTVKQTTDGQRVFNVNAGRTVSIYDCAESYNDDEEYVGGVMTGGSRANGSAVWISRNGGVLNLYGGRISGNTKADDAYGGAVYLQSGKLVSEVQQDGAVFNMYGGELVGNGTSGVSLGGAVYLYGEAAASRGGAPATFNMYGGLIQGNQAKNGGAVYGVQDAVINIQGGTISDNQASNYAGAIYAQDNVAVTVKNAKITGNTAGSQGTIWTKGDVTVTLENAEISGNTAPIASAFYSQNNVLLTVKDSTITGNIGSNTNSAGYGAALYICGGGTKVIVSGKTFIADNVMKNEAIADLFINSNATGAPNEMLYVKDLNGYVKFGVKNKAATLTEASEIVCFEGEASTFSNGAVSYMAGTEEKHVGLVDGSFKFVTGHFHEGVEYTAWTAADSLPDSGTYYLENDVTLTSRANVAIVNGGNTLKLCVNGKTVSGNNSTTVMESVRVEDGSVYISDCTTVYDENGYFVSGGKFINGLRKGNGAALYANNAASVVVVEGVEFSGNNATETNEAYGGGAVQIRENTTPAKFIGCLFDSNTSSGGAGALALRDGGDVILENCVFTNNTAKHGGAIFITGTSAKPSTLVIDSCKITDNTASNVGAINNLGVCSVIIKDTVITGNSNTSTVGYGAVNCGNANAVVKIQGDTVIYDNLNKDGNQQNLHAQQYEGVAYDLSGLGANAKIGVSLIDTRIEAGYMYFSTTGMTAVPSGVTSDDASYKVVVDDQGRLALAEDDGGAVTPPVTQGHTHKLCNDASCTSHGDAVEFEAWTDATTLPTEGNYYLDVNVTMSATMSSTGDLNLCLNGHTVKSASGTRLQINKGTTVSVTDCGTTGTITGGTATYGSAVSVRHGGVFNLFAGKITGNNSTSEGTVYIQGGKIEGTTSEPVAGTFNMYGGEISGNTAKLGGAVSMAAPVGAVTQNPAVNIYGGKITGNTTTGRGSAINASGVATIYIENAEISGNTSGGDGTIYATNGSTVTIKNAKIKDNDSKTGAAISTYGGTLTLDGAVIEGNHSTGGYSAVHPAVSSTAGTPIVILKGATVITGNTNGTDKTPSNLYLRNNVMFDVSGLTNAAKIGLYRQSARTQDRVSTAALASANEVARFESDLDTYEVDQDAEGYLVLAAFSAHSHKLCNDSACADHSDVTFRKWSATDSLPTSGYYYLENDVVLTATSYAEGELVLCLNGKTITQSAATRVLQTKTGGSLTITDCGTTGTITGGRNDTGASIFVTDSTTFNLYGGKITGSAPATSGSVTAGSAIFLRSTSGAGATFNMYGGEITGNGDGKSWAGAIGNASGNANNYVYVNIYGGKIYGNTAGTGGAIRMEKKSVTTIYGGEIYGNTATGNGGAIYLSSGSPELIIKGGKIYDNTAANGGGIYVSSGAKVTLEGDVTIYDNTASDKQNNLYLAGSDKITLGELKDTAKIGINATTYNRAISELTDVDCSASFLPDNSKLSVTYKENALWLEKVETSDHYHRVCADVKHEGCEHDANQMWIKWGDDEEEKNTLPSTSGYYYLTQDIQMSANIVMNANQDISLCLNGHTVTAAENNRHFALEYGTTMNITDCTDEPGGFTGGSRTYGGSVNIVAGATLNLYAGKFYGNTAPDNEGGAIYLQGSKTIESTGVHRAGGVLNMYGGEIYGNTAKTGAAIRAAGIGSTGTKDPSIVNIYGGKIYNNYAKGTVTVNEETKVETKSGGCAAVAITSSTVMNMYGGEISGNKSDSSGGGIYMSAASKLYIKGGKIDGNSSGSTGGGIFVTGTDSTVTMDSGSISGNSATNGGGIITQTKSLFTMNGGTISGNKTTANGAGVYVSTNTDLVMNGGTITGNQGKSGAGIYAYRSRANLNGGTVSYNYAKAQTTVNATTGAETKSGGTAGAMYISGAKVNLSGTSFIGNTSDVNGGAIMMGRASYKENGVTKYDLVTVNVYGGLFSGNKTEGSGGAMLIQSEGTVVNMYGGTFTNNQAKSAGAIYVSSKTKFNMTGGTITRNHATNNAGAFYVYLSTATITGGQIYSNTSVTNGGMFVVSGNTAVLTLKNMKLHDGASKIAGAIVSQAYGHVYAENCDIYDNKADGSSGGAIYISNNSFGDFTDCKFYNNTTTNYSGAIHCQINSTVNITRCDFTENTAGTVSGAMYCNPKSVITITDSTFSKNTANAEGGALVCRGTMYLTNTTFENNSAANGGAVATDTNNTGGAGVLEGLIVKNCVFRNNTATEKGGAFYIWKGRPLHLYDSKITGNTAGAEGGAIWAYEDTQLHNTTITGNTSGGEGYAVYMNDANYDGHSYYTSKNKLSGDVIIKDNQGGDLWMGPDVSFAITAEGLGENAHIELVMDSGMVTNRILGAYHYEGGNQVYTITYGDRSMTDPEYDASLAAAKSTESEKTEKADTGDVLLYVGIGIFVLAIIAVAVVLVTKKKKAGKAAADASKE